jgi:hypothetical protein
MEVGGWVFLSPWWLPPAELSDSLGNAPETYHRRFTNVLIVNGPQYYYCLSQIQPDDTDTCELHCLYYCSKHSIITTMHDDIQC